jgi:oligopeptide transport system substrate-binding protein
MSNGPFMLERWDNSRAIQLIPNQYYSEEFTALPERIIFYIGRDDPLDQFRSGNSDLILLSGLEAAQPAPGGTRLIPVEETVWCLVFNLRRDYFRNPLLRQAIAHSIDRSGYGGELPESLSVAERFVPPGMKVGGFSFGELAGGTTPLPFDEKEAEELYALALDVFEVFSLPTIALYYPDSDGHGQYLGIMQQGWQRRLNFHAALEANSPNQLEDRLASGDFRIMLMPFSPKGENPHALLGDFRSGDPRNYFGYVSGLFDDKLTLAADEETPELAISRFRIAEEVLLRDAAIIPLYYETSYYAAPDSITGLEISPFSGQILFAMAEKR